MQPEGPLQDGRGEGAAGLRPDDLTGGPFPHGDWGEPAQRLDDKQGCRVAYTVTSGGYRSDEAKWPEIQDAMIDAMVRLEKALNPHLAKLKVEGL